MVTLLVIVREQTSSKSLLRALATSFIKILLLAILYYLFCLEWIQDLRKT
ncbi:UNVERIFIED_CONTAM: hypothetical protein GTU68_030575 [Idotea baltica]|nr:hypothetical protein [Idotea baltica]